ncbi:hypothetical protein KW782_04055 [Candidatus Parcubacteria bacterium]|nr:hypothetical protein [Candidatus Parcubacteria bacterium]
MTWASRRKLIYFSILFALFLIGVGIPAFLVYYEKPTCFDTKRNQDEQGIDCGGVCAKLCRNIELQPVVRWQQVFPVTEGLYTAVAYINNPNLTAESYNVPYVFTLYDSNNTVVTTRKGKAYIPPGKNFAIVEARITARDRIPVRALFEFDQSFSWQRVQNQMPEVTVKNQLLSDAETAPRISAEIENGTFKTIDTVTVAVLVYDTQGNAFAASKTVIDNVPAQSGQQIFFTWPKPFTKQVSRIEIIPIPQ